MRIDIPAVVAIKERFLKKTFVDKNGCWIWTGSRIRKQYGRFSVEGKARFAHRVSWELFNGKIPPEKEVCHHCDVKPCVNPAHLFVGTRQDNMDDAVKKDRLWKRKGSENPTAKLTDKKVREIRKRHLDGEKLSPLSKEFGVSYQALYMIVNNKNWKHVA